VATTRAISKLYLLANVKLDEKTAVVKKPASSSLLSSIWQAVADRLVFSDAAIKPAETAAEATPAGVWLRRLPSNWQPPILAQDELLQSYRQDPMRGKPLNVDNLADNTTARHSGTVLHEYLQAICLQGIASWQQQSSAARSSHIGYRLKELGVRALDIEQACSRISTQLTDLLNTELGRWVLANDYRESECEWPLQSVVAGQVVKLIIDRSFIDDEDCRWIIDYKSARPVMDQSIGAFIDEQKTLYSPQLHRYRAAVASLQQQMKQTYPIRIALYFVTINQLVTID
jgi:ATP-dependent exoDNAse (exonuclease V) beta subunit